jgi:hypothetical protein
MAAIKKYTSEKWHGALDKFTKNPTLENAQKAQSDLGKLERELGKKATLTSEEKATLDAAKSAKEHIRDSMFKTEKGELNAPLKNMYDKVTKSYEENVIPYTTNKAIQEFKRGDITAKELIQKISKGKFRARKGKDHPELAGREITLDVLNKLGLPVGTGGAIAGGNWLINKLTSD